MTRRRERLVRRAPHNDSRRHQQPPHTRPLPADDHRRPRALYLENRLDCRVWAYYCELRHALARRLTLVSRDDALRDGVDLVIVGPRYATNIVNADEPLGVSRALLRHVPLVLVQNKMYAPSTREYVGSRSAKMAWARQLGVAVAFSWVRRDVAKFTNESSIPHRFLSFGVDAERYGAHADEHLEYTHDVGFTGASGPKYPLRESLLRAVRAMNASGEARAYTGTWRQTTGAVPVDQRWALLSRDGYVRQLARTKMWISTLGPSKLVGTRYFEVLASGTTLLLCEADDEAYEGLFADGVHARFFRNASHMASLARYYLAHDDERTAIVRAARSLAVEKHTWDRRAEYILEALREANASHEAGAPWYEPPPAASVHTRARLRGCLETSGRLDVANASQPYEATNASEQPRGVPSRGFNVSGCEARCAARVASGFGLLCSGACGGGNAHMRARCLCGAQQGAAADAGLPTSFAYWQGRGHTAVLKAHALSALDAQSAAADPIGGCSSTCSAHDDRPCGGRNPRSGAVRVSWYDFGSR